MLTMCTNYTYKLIMERTDNSTAQQVTILYRVPIKIPEMRTHFHILRVQLVCVCSSRMLLTIS